MAVDKKLLAKFRHLLMAWNHQKNTRQMPWKGEKDPYKIWLSEIILQQTRVEQGLTYYEKFVSHFPNISKLAAAKDEVIYKYWEGLGYYSRCRNLIQTARFISKELDGKFPKTYLDILALKGVGQYTASAIASFAYNLPYAVVDGNVFRVLSRFFGISIPIDSTKGKKFFSGLANDLLDKSRPGTYNQAIMDFGAVVCKPLNPFCDSCPFRNDCHAFQNNIVGKLPVKEKKLKVKERMLNYLVIEHDGKIFIRQRTENDIWRNLYELYLIEAARSMDPKTILTKVEKEIGFKKSFYKVQSISDVYTQQLTHQKIKGLFIRIELKKPLSIPGYNYVSIKQLSGYAFPRFINNWLEKAGLRS